MSLDSRATDFYSRSETPSNPGDPSSNINHHASQLTSSTTKAHSHDVIRNQVTRSADQHGTDCSLRTKMHSEAVEDAEHRPPYLHVCLSTWAIVLLCKYLRTSACSLNAVTSSSHRHCEHFVSCVVADTRDSLCWLGESEAHAAIYSCIHSIQSKHDSRATHTSRPSIHRCPLHI
jgi:hypothetical protein